VQRGSWRHLEDKVELLVKLDDLSEVGYGPGLARVDNAVEAAGLQFLLELTHGTALLRVLAVATGAGVDGGLHVASRQSLVCDWVEG